MCVPSLVWTLNGRPVFQHSLVDVKDSMVSFMKSTQAITRTMAKFQIPALMRLNVRPGQAVCEDSGQAYPGRPHKKGGIMVAVKEEEQLMFICPFPVLMYKFLDYTRSRWNKSSGISTNL